MLSTILLHDNDITNEIMGIIDINNLTIEFDNFYPYNGNVTIDELYTAIYI